MVGGKSWQTCWCHALQLHCSFLLLFGDGIVSQRSGHRSGTIVGLGRVQCFEVSGPLMPVGGMTSLDDTYIFGCRDGVLGINVFTSVETASYY